MPFKFLKLTAVTLVLLILVPLLSSSALSAKTSTGDMPYTFFMTHYELLGDANKPDGVRYHNEGQPSAKALDGSSITLMGKGAWDPSSKRATGGGQYTIKDTSGAAKAHGSWQVTGFISFEQLDGWWPDGFKEEGWQGPSGSPTFSGFLTVTVTLENQGDGVLLAWCLMPTVHKPGNHTADGIALVGSNFSFTDFRDSEKSLEGMMFYSTDPASRGYALDAKGRTILKPAVATKAATKAK